MVIWLGLALSISLSAQTTLSGPAQKDATQTSTTKCNVLDPKCTASQSKQGMNQAANKGQGSQALGKIINLATSATMFAGCFSCKPPCYTMCMMGALAAAQAAVHSGAAGESGNVADFTNPFSTDFDFNSGKATGDSAKGITNSSVDPSFAGDKALITKGLQALRDAGYVQTPEGFVTPDGKTIAAASLGNAAALSEAGFSSSEISKAMAALEKVNTELGEVDAPNVVAMGVANPGGAAGATNGFSESSFEVGEDPFAAHLAALRAKLNPGLDQKKKILDGKTTRFGDEVIGVGVNNIFTMMHQRYQVKRAENRFMEDALSEKPVLRRPAALQPPRK